jgi:hypothetical protein
LISNFAFEVHHTENQWELRKSNQLCRKRSSMAALAAELQLTHLGQSKIATTSYGSSEGGYDRRISRVGFSSRTCGSRSRHRAIRPVSFSSIERLMPLNECGKLKISKKRFLGQELGTQWCSAKVGTTRRSVAVHVFSVLGGVEAPKPTYVPLEPITSEDQFDKLLSEAEERDQAVIVDWYG